MSALPVNNPVVPEADSSASDNTWPKEPGNSLQRSVSWPPDKPRSDGGKVLLLFVWTARKSARLERNSAVGKYRGNGTVEDKSDDIAGILQSVSLDVIEG